VHPGADWATADVHDGLVPALQALGVECVPYALNARIDRAASWLLHVWEQAGSPADDKPSDADVAYQASIGALERALRLDVDLVLVVSGMFLHPDALILLRRAGCRVALLLTESPYEDESEARLLKLVDVAWTNERTCVEPYRQHNSRVYYLPHAYDPARHRPGDDPETADSDVPAHDVVFVATPFPERIATLEAVDWTGVDLGLYGFWNEALGADSPLRPYLRGGVITNAEAVNLYRRAKIGLNLYRTSRGFDGRGHVEGAESLNPRALELAGCNVFQISDYRAEVEEVFGEFVPTFTDPQDLGRLVRRYLASDDERARKAGCARNAIKRHTFAERAEQILNELDWSAA
jgi:glycosyltransferase involved in cell wall biosynthesis